MKEYASTGKRCMDAVSLMTTDEVGRVAIIVGRDDGGCSMWVILVSRRETK